MGCTQSSTDRLSDCTYENTPPFLPEVTSGKCVKVYDGDTIHVACQVHGRGPYRFSCRMMGYDSAEMRTKDPAERQPAVRARQELAVLVEHKPVTLHVHGQDKYGRLLVSVTVGRSFNVNEHMIRERFGVAYDGGTKRKVDWSQYPH